MKNHFSYVEKLGIALACLGLSACGVENIGTQNVGLDAPESSVVNDAGAQPSVETYGNRQEGETGREQSSAGGESGATEGVQEGSGSTAQQEESPVVVTNNVPVAMPDTGTTSLSEDVVIYVLDNDGGLEDGQIVVTLDSAPRNGDAYVNSDGSVTYVPSGLFVGEDSFTYRATDRDGDISMASVTVNVECSVSCSGGQRTVRLSWAHDDELNIDGYYLYHGTLSGEFSSAIWLGSDTQYDFTTDIIGPHYFAVTAVDLQNAESNYSEEIYVNLQ